MTIDFHTHNLDKQDGSAIVNLPREWVLNPGLFRPQPRAFYSAGIHPWWTENADETARMLENLPLLLAHPQVIRMGECGLDALRGADLNTQEQVFLQQIDWAEKLHLPLTLHIVRAYDKILHLHKSIQPTTDWTIHGFRGKPALARQLLQAGFHLSFGRLYNPESLSLTPPEMRHFESDEEGVQGEAYEI